MATSRSWLVNQSRLGIVVTWFESCWCDLQFGPDTLALDFLKRLRHNDQSIVLLIGSGGERYSEICVTTSCHSVDHFAISDTVPSIENVVLKLKVGGSVISTFAPTLTAVDLLTSLPRDRACVLDVFNFEGYLVGHSHFILAFRCPALICGDTSRFRLRSSAFSERGVPRPSACDPHACPVVKLLSYF